MDYSMPSSWMEGLDYLRTAPTGCGPIGQDFAFVKDCPLGSAVTLGGLLLRDAVPL